MSADLEALKRKIQDLSTGEKLTLAAMFLDKAKDVRLARHVAQMALNDLDEIISKVSR